MPLVLTLADVGLTPDRLATLLALGEALAAIGALRAGQAAGQISMHNFRLRSAWEPVPPTAMAARLQSEQDITALPGLVVLMQAGVFRRHAWHGRVLDPHGAAPLLHLPRPIDPRWTWWPAVTEIRDRLAIVPAWTDAGLPPLLALLAVWAERVGRARVLAQP